MLRKFLPAPKELGVTAAILLCVTGIGALFARIGLTEANIVTVYILGVLLISIWTKGYVCGALASILSVSLFNFFYTEPRLTLRAYDSGYWVTFAVMLASSVLTATLASKLKDQAALSTQAAERTRVLLETNQLLQKAADESAMFQITMRQLTALLQCDMVLYSQAGDAVPFSKREGQTLPPDCFSAAETQAVQWVFRENRSTVQMQTFSECRFLYYPVAVNSEVYGVAGIRIADGVPNAAQTDVLRSVLAECALAVENSRNAAAKEKAAAQVKNERLRANLLRMISHDLRSPLTAISGNAGNLLSNDETLSAAERQHIYQDIAQDAQWLTDLVENLLAITRVSEESLHLNLSIELMEDIVREAMEQVQRRCGAHPVSAQCAQELLIVRADARLLVQVIVNLVDNAVKYTPPDTPIRITLSRGEHCAVVRVMDWGSGIPDSEKAHIFDLFFTGALPAADSRRGLGLGLALCQSIVQAHHGEISVTDNDPHGCIFTFSVPLGEVEIHA